MNKTINVKGSHRKLSAEPSVFLNGEFVAKSAAQVSIFDRGFLFGDGVYEVVPVVQSTVVDFAPFVERMRYSLSELALSWPNAAMQQFGEPIDSQLERLLKELIERNQLEEGGVYLQITRGVAPRDFSFPNDTLPTIVAFTFEKVIMQSPLAEKGVKVVTTDDLRWKRRDIKSVALLAQCLAKQVASENAAFEAWMVEDGCITEGSSSSAYIVKDKVIITRPLSKTILPGIRRKVLLKLAAKQGLQVEERAFTVEEAYNADEAFLSSATTLVLPIIEIDGTQIGSGKVGAVSKVVRELYLQAVMSQL